MRFTFTIGRMVLFDINLFQFTIDEGDQPDVVVVHHYKDEEEKPEEPGDLFGDK